MGTSIHGWLTREALTSLEHLHGPELRAGREFEYNVTGVYICDSQSGSTTLFNKFYQNGVPATLMKLVSLCDWITCDGRSNRTNC